MEVVLVDYITEEDFKLVIAWVAVVAVFLSWMIRLGIITEVNEEIIYLFNLIELLIGISVDYSLLIMNLIEQLIDTFVY
jgi:hypothetical protein